MNTTRFQLLEKLRQSKLTAALTRSKVITKSPTPYMDEIARLAKERNISCDDLSAAWIAGKIELPSLDMILAAKTTASAAAKPSALQAAWDKGLAKGKPVQITALSTYKKLEHSDPIAAGKFFAQNKTAILAEAGLSDIIKSHT